MGEKIAGSSENKTTINGHNNEFQARPKTMAEIDPRDNQAWFYSFAAAMVPFTAFCYGHQRGVTVRVIEKLAKTPGGIYGLFVLPFVTLAMEKSIYDTVQSWQGIDPTVIPEDRGGFPSGGGNLPSFSLVPVNKSRSVTNMHQNN